MGLNYLRLVLQLLLIVHNSSVSGVIGHEEEEEGGVEVNRKVILSEEVSVRWVPMNRRGGTSGGHGGSGGEGSGGNGESGGEHTPNTGSMIPVYGAAANHHGKNHHHAAANASNGSINLATLVTAILTSLHFTFS